MISDLAKEILLDSARIAEAIGEGRGGDAIVSKLAFAVARGFRALSQRPAALPLRAKRIGDHQLPLPSYAHEGDAGLDLAAVIDSEKWTLSDGPGYSWRNGEELVIGPDGRAKMPTGFAFEIPVGYEGCVRPRSGWTSKGVIAHVGTIDSTYRGEVFVILENRSGEWVRISHGSRIAQLVVSPVARCELSEGELGASERMDRGFGSTGA